MPRLSLDGKPLTDAEQRLILVALLDAKVTYSRLMQEWDTEGTVKSWLRAQYNYNGVIGLIDRISGVETKPQSAPRRHKRQPTAP